MSKLTVKELNQRVESKFDSIDDKVQDLKDTIHSLKSNLVNIQGTIKRIIAKHSSEIRVLEQDGTWGGYTGVFYTNKEDNKQVVIDKAINHYEVFFEDRSFYKDKTLALFVSDYKGKKLVKVLQDTKDKLGNKDNLHEDTIEFLKDYFKNQGGEDVSIGK